MKSFTTSLLGIALCCASLQAGAIPVDVVGTATASGFANSPSGFTGTPVAGPYDDLTADFSLTYDDAATPTDGDFSVALTSLMLAIGPAMFDATNSSAVLTFVADVLVGITVGADANGGPTVTVPGTNDFVFSNVQGVEAFRYTADGFPPGPDPLTGSFETLSAPGASIGQVMVTFTTAPQQLPLPATSLLLAGGLGFLAMRRRGAGRREAGILDHDGHSRAV